MDQAQVGTWSQEGRNIRWHLDLLAVCPSRRKRGVGSLLVSWGMKNGAKEGVICSLESSPAGKGLYERLGFKMVDVWVPFEGSKEGFEKLTAPMMVWQPGTSTTTVEANGVAEGKTAIEVVVEDWSVNGAREGSDMG